MDRGAHFYRCDFQVHSPRDRQWVGAGCVSEEERKQYAASLIRACRDKGLDAIAITDHHDLCFARYVRDAARAEMDSDGRPIVPERQIVVFPGIELTLNVPCQAILLWDANLPDDLFSLVLTALAIAGASAADAKTIETKRLSHITTLTMLRDELDKHAYLRNRYIILPNVSEGGPDTLLRSGNAAKYASMPCVGGYVDGAITQHGTGNNNIVDGKASEYGNKRIAVFQTSDNRREDHSDLGSHSTWVKWAVPTAEALRQACLAQESRISHALPELPAVTITALSVSNSAFLGPIELEFNAQYSALIGGRGTGKSTILEYLRWGLCDQLPSPAPDDELPNYQVRRKSLIEKTLQTVNATVQVRFIVNGIAHVVRRNSKTDEVQLKVGDGEFSVCKEADVRTLLPIQAYSQKQLSNVSVRLDELSRFLEAPIRTELDDLDKQFERASAEMRQVYATLLRKRRLQRQLANDELQLTSLTEQAANVRASLSGLSDADSATLAAKAEYEKAEELRQIWLSDIEQTTEAIDNAANVLDTLPTETEIDDTSLPEAATLGAIKKEVLQYIGIAKALIDDLKRRRANVISEVGEYAGALKTHWDSWGNALALFNERYDQTKGRATAHSSQLAQLANIERRIGEVRIAVAGMRREIVGLGTPETRYIEIRDSWLHSRSQRTSLVETECETLTTRSQGEIRATIHVGAGVDAVLQKLRAAIAGSGLRREKVDALGETMRAADGPDDEWMAVLGELEHLAAYDPEDDGEMNMPACPRLAACGFANADLFRVANKLDEDAWLELSLSRLEDHPEFEYRVREAEYIPFANASAGQQATALLKALLNQPGPPLMIDQPEEDLDNPVILEVVSQIWQAKKTRQLILSSHNANLVVNGDAEMVVWCDYRVAGDHSGGQIRETGAIDMPEICDAIKQVMEGGEAAFKLRKEKYGF